MFRLLSALQGFGVHHVLNPDPYRGPHGADGKRYAEDVSNLIESATPGRVAGFFAETIQVSLSPAHCHIVLEKLAIFEKLIHHPSLSGFWQGVGGAVELAPGYLAAAYEAVRKAGGICIADEVQTGFGRTGSHYWGFQTQNVTPDIVTLAKVMSDSNCKPPNVHRDVCVPIASIHDLQACLAGYW